jgi:aerobic C4-dicarboxylate transport protein
MATTPRRPWYTILYVQVLLAIAAGVLIGHYFPNTGVALKPLGDGFISLIKMMIGPVIFCTVVHGASGHARRGTRGAAGLGMRQYSHCLVSSARGGRYGSDISNNG